MCLTYREVSATLRCVSSCTYCGNHPPPGAVYPRTSIEAYAQSYWSLYLSGVVSARNQSSSGSARYR